MNTSDFKSKVKEIKGFLTGKEITIEFLNNNQVQKIECKSLRHFGNMVLKLEQLGASFNFLTVANHLTTRNVSNEKELNKWMNRGVWSEVRVLATTVKY